MTKKEILTLFLTLLFWFQVTVIIFLGFRWLLKRQNVVSSPTEVKTPAMIRNKI